MMEVVRSVMSFIHNDSFNVPRTGTLKVISLGLNALKETDTRQKPESLTC